MADLRSVSADLTAEGDALDALVDGLDDARWATATPAPGWTIAHQIAHLHWTDHAAALTARDAAGDEDGTRGFDALLDVAAADVAGFVDHGAEDLAPLPPRTLLDRWRAGRIDLAHALNQVPDGAKLRWFGPPMSATSMATARIMETWAHGQDVADALGVVREPTERLRHVAHLGVRTRNFAFLSHGEPPPAVDFFVDLEAPNGERWTWGSPDAEQRVEGTALDFCLLVTQRVHRDDTELAAVGDDADRWLSIAQAFAGTPGAGRTVRA